MSKIGTKNLEDTNDDMWPEHSAHSHALTDKERKEHTEQLVETARDLLGLAAHLTANEDGITEPDDALQEAIMVICKVHMAAVYGALEEKIKDELNDQDQDQEG